ncbi:MAG: hypothetical protein EBZ77_05170 [Chitinophagia bacterium]|nr:hypothetical protein [Chitinophagia bacterium]
MQYHVIVYVAYLLITIGLCIWVAQTLFRNGQVFLIDIFNGDKEIAGAVNNLLYVGFYLVNLGYAVYTLKTTAFAVDAVTIIEILSAKVGAIIIILGGMHFLNMYVFFRLRRRAQADRRYAESVNNYQQPTNG